MSCPHGNPIGDCDICDEVDAAFEAGKQSVLAEQPAQQEPVAWVDGATHYQPHQKAFYKRVSATEWYVWSRVEQEPLHWCKALGTSDSAHWILRQPAQRTWVGLTDEDVRQCSRDVVAGGSENSVDRFAYTIEAKLKEKNA